MSEGISVADPMTGTPQEQADYLAMLAQKSREAMDEAHKFVQRPSPSRESQPVMIGDAGFPGGISSAAS